MSKPEEFNKQEFDAGRLTWQHITRAIQQAQAVLSLDIDGKAGPATRAALVPAPEQARCATCGNPGPDGHNYRHPFKAAPLPPPIDRLKAAGERALNRALAEWKLHIVDPKRTDKSERAVYARGAITNYIHFGLGWTWQPPYAGDGAFEWCGAFAAWCWLESLLPELRRDYLPSCYRLFNWTQGLEALGGKPKAPITPPTFLALDENSKPSDVLRFAGTGPRAGDLLIVGDGKPEYGEHITIVERFEATGGLGTFYTVEGNGGGSFPDGNRGQGVVRALRTLGKRAGGGSYIARRLLRPTLAHLVAP